MPNRVQMRRDRPWRADHPDAVIVARPTAWGNPFRVGDPDISSRAQAVHAFEEWLARTPEGQRLQRRAADELSGRDLACWCPLDQPCHADVLIRVANAPPGAPRGQIP